MKSIQQCCCRPVTALSPHRTPRISTMFHRWISWFRQYVVFIQSKRDEYILRQELSGMSDFILRDIGMSRDCIHRSDGEEGYE
ncbi:DUF1127 domain-containing protein [Desulfovibrio inopinatus]|uniref:DUF1127 domain-containing protein n=1 Tax=Desulfovibrio inopinatus TaxID=102109 RepID=UPI000487AFC3|nr:DUF1127 domain-containing protein [Desulfovibrio inopinatus]